MFSHAYQIKPLAFGLLAMFLFTLLSSYKLSCVRQTKVDNGNSFGQQKTQLKSTPETRQIVYYTPSDWCTFLIVGSGEKYEHFSNWRHQNSNCFLLGEFLFWNEWSFSVDIKFVKLERLWGLHNQFSIAFSLLAWLKSQQSFDPKVKR